MSFCSCCPFHNKWGLKVKRLEKHKKASLLKQEENNEVIAKKSLGDICDELRNIGGMRYEDP